MPTNTLWYNLHLKALRAGIQILNARKRPHLPSPSIRESKQGEILVMRYEVSKHLRTGWNSLQGKVMNP